MSYWRFDCRMFLGISDLLRKHNHIIEQDKVVNNYHGCSREIYAMFTKLIFACI